MDELRTRLSDETDEQNKTAKFILKGMRKPYKKKYRDSHDGPRNMDQGIELREDFYAYTFLYMLKRKVLFDDGDSSEDSDDETVPENEPEGDAAVGDAEEEKDKMPDSSSDEEEDKADDEGQDDAGSIQMKHFKDYFDVDR